MVVISKLLFVVAVLFLSVAIYSILDISQRLEDRFRGASAAGTISTASAVLAIAVKIVFQ
jgi:hypothetical protein